MHISILYSILGCYFLYSQSLDAMESFSEETTQHSLTTKSKFDEITKNIDLGTRHKLATLLSTQECSEDELVYCISNIFNNQALQLIGRSALLDVKNEHYMNQENTIIHQYLSPLSHRLRIAAIQAKHHSSGIEAFGWLSDYLTEKEIDLAEALFKTMTFSEDYDFYQEVIEETLKEKRNYFSKERKK